jgi:integrase
VDGPRLLDHAGVRVSEFCGLDGVHVDVAAARLRIPRSATKIDAGERIVPAVTRAP